MNSSTWFSCALALLLLFDLQALFAQSPTGTVSKPNQDQIHEPVTNTILYQGYLTDTNGGMLLDGVYEITFRLYDQEKAGTMLWTETRNVEVVGGIFALHLGQENNLESVDFSLARFLSLQLQGETEIHERFRLSAVPFSLLAADVEEGKVVKGINGLTDQVQIVAGEGISVSQGDNGQLVISARTGLEGSTLDTSSLRQGASGGDDGPPEPFITFNEVIRAKPTNSFHELGPNGGLTVENTAGGAANINFIRSSGGVDQSYYRFVNRINGHFNIRDIIVNKSPFVVEQNANNYVLVVDSLSRVGVGTNVPAYALDVIDDIHASKDIIASDDIISVDDLVAGALSGDGDVDVRQNNITTIFLEGGSNTGGLIQVEDETGNSIGVELFNTANDGGQIDVNDDNNNAVVHAFAGTDHGLIQNKQSDGSVLVSIDQLNANTGGRVEIKDEAGAALIRLEAGALGTGSFAHFTGVSNRSMTWDAHGGLTVSGPSNTTTSLNLPPGSVQPYEIQGEAGIANTHSDASISLTGGNDILLTRSITAPVPGYVLVIGTAQFNLGGGLGLDYGVSDDCDATPTLPSHQDFFIFDGVGSTSSIPGTAHGIFFVTSGAHTFCLLANDSTTGGAGTVNDRQLDLLFVPTFYGTVVSNQPNDGVLDANQPAAAPISFEAERIQSIADNEARIQSELERMQTQIDALKALLAQQDAAKGTQDIPQPKPQRKEDDRE